MTRSRLRANSSGSGDDVPGGKRSRQVGGGLSLCDRAARLVAMHCLPFFVCAGRAPVVSVHAFAGLGS